MIKVTIDVLMLQNISIFFLFMNNLWPLQMFTHPFNWIFYTPGYYPTSPGRIKTSLGPGLWLTAGPPQYT